MIVVFRFHFKANYSFERPWNLGETNLRCKMSQSKEVLDQYGKFLTPPTPTGPWRLDEVNLLATILGLLLQKERASGDAQSMETGKWICWYHLHFPFLSNLPLWPNVLSWNTPHFNVIMKFYWRLAEGLDNWGSLVIVSGVNVYVNNYVNPHLK